MVKRQMLPGMMTGNAASFGLGVLSALAVGAVVPSFGRSLRPLGKKAIKLGLRVGEDLARRAAEGKETLEDLVAESRAEYDAERMAEESAAKDAAPDEPAT